MKKMISVLLAAVMALAVPVCSFAAEASADDDMSFRFELTADGKESASVEPGGEVSVEAVLKRTDRSEGFPMYAVQYDIYYNSDIFELIADSLSGGSQDMKVSARALDGSRDGWSCVSASKYSSAIDGEAWGSEETLVSFKLRAKKVGSASLQSKNCSVSRSDGMSSYNVSANDAVISVKTAAGGASSGDKKDDGKSDSAGGGSGSSGSSGGTGGSGGSASAGGGGSAGAVAKPDAPTEAPKSDASAAVRPSERFSDIPAGAWYESAVSYALEKGLVTGTSEKTFSPDGTMTRAMLVTMLWRMDGKPAASGASSFNDVKGGQWYSEAVSWAAANGIVTGYGDGAFGVSDDVTRQQLAAVLYRYAAFKGKDVSASTDISGYADAYAVAPWADAAVRWAVKSGVMNGASGNRLTPSGTATRAQASAMLMRYASI